MSRLKPKSDPTDIEKLVGKIEVYGTRLGEHRYTMVFLNAFKIHGRRKALIYTGKMVNNRLYGIFLGIRQEDVSGKRISLKDVPTDLIEDAMKEMQ